MRRLSDVLRADGGADKRAAEGADTSVTRAALRETARAQMTASIGGWQGMLIAALPPVVFVIVNTASGLRPAIVAAIATGIILATYRFARKQPVQQALSGLFGVLIAALIAARTGQARGYFLFGIWQSFIYAVPFGVSVLVRRPLVGVIWEFLDPTPDDGARPWYRRRGLLAAYMIATLIATSLFLSRGIVQATLYGDNSTGWLAFARIVMGYPLSIVALAMGYWVVRRARARLAASPPAQSQDVAEHGTSGDVASADDGAAQR